MTFCPYRKCLTCQEHNLCRNCIIWVDMREGNNDNDRFSETNQGIDWTSGARVYSGARTGYRG
jgi:hypothetical protein